ncbi:hypothetical protein CMV_007421 [Castanea mollissima]|uniref:Exocyst subunit Exo70 family protein n=1 Tax=Castanea mollissima TaxID=60419 RepID=A0A8J4RV11_9ROSI|nr:hypothetical protein CMV_007421 [Castanea mollissima]
MFASEKKLCEQIFENLGTDIDDACFVETVKGPAIQLFNLFEAISISRRSPEKLFKILDLHDALMVLIPDIDIVFLILGLFSLLNFVPEVWVCELLFVVLCVLGVEF